MQAEIRRTNLSSAAILKPLLATAALLATFSPNLKAAEHWIRLTTPHFEMYTTNGEKQGTAALKVFEQVRYFFLQNSKSKTVSDTPVRIIAFRSEKEYRPYRLSEGGFAYYLRSRKVDYIVMQDISPEHHQAAVHEYTHLVIQHLGLNLPIWFNEGLAELYSSLEGKGDQAVVGRPLEGRLIILMTQRWLDLNALFAVGADSPYYNERDKMSIFYAESWALTHMLALGKDYRAGFPRFLAAIASGRPAPDCFQSVYGKGLAEVTHDLRAYTQQSTVQAAIFDVKLSKPDLEPDVSEASQFNLDLTLADLLASQKKTSVEAAERLSKLASEHPESPDVQESLGYLAWEEGNTAKARESFRLALDRGSKNPEMLYHYSQLLRESGASAGQILPVLQRAVAIKPDYWDAWLDLGLTATNDRQWGVALSALSQIKRVGPERAYALFSALAYCDLQMKELKQARAMAERAKQYAKSPDQELQISSMLRHLDALDQMGEVQSAAVASSSEPLTPQTSTPDTASMPGHVNRERPRDVPSVHWSGNLQHVEAVAKFFDCATRAPRLHVAVNSKEMVFELDDPKGVIVRNRVNGSFDFQCGPQKPFKVGIFYVPSNTSTAVDGIIRELVF
jgi:tetratricopeptide (TPR) repeat protein